MEIQQFIDKVKSPEKIQVSEIEIFNKIATEFPFFQTAHLLYLKSLSKGNINSIFENQLKVAAAYSINREKLFSLLMSEKTSSKNSVINKKQAKQKTTDEITESFIRNEPRIKPKDSDFSESIKIANKSIEDNDDIISETLAEIYINQGDIEKGINIYNKLCLKYPKKSSYFAAILEKIKIINK